MAVLESRPYRTALPHSASASISLLEPDVPIEDLSTSWRPGQTIRIAVDVEVRASFWQETGASPWDGVILVASAVCLPARAAWRSTAPIDASRPEAAVRVVVEVDGEVAAGEVQLEVWLAGPGRTNAGGATDSLHLGAKLWQSAAPVRLLLNDDRSAFPTIVIPFASTGRPEVPWTVEHAGDAEPGWSVDASLRLCLNSRLGSTARITAGTAENHIYELIRADIRMAAVRALAVCSTGMSPDDLDALAAEIPESLAGLGVQSAAAMDLTTAQALRMALDDPLLLMAHSREASRFYREGEGA